VSVLSTARATDASNESGKVVVSSIPSAAALAVMLRRMGFRERRGRW
jgi:hypothetical protein